MAFVGAISDLFSCGKPRKPQARETALDLETSNAPAAERDVTAEPLPSVRLGAPIDLGTIHTPPDRIRTPPSEDATLDFGVRTREFGHEKQRQNREDDVVPPLSPVLPRARSDPENVPDEVTRDPFERYERPSKDEKIDHKAWLVEQRILVTSNAEIEEPQIRNVTPPPATPKVELKRAKTILSQREIKSEEGPAVLENTAPSQADHSDVETQPEVIDTPKPKAVQIPEPKAIATPASPAPISSPIATPAASEATISTPPSDEIDHDAAPVLKAAPKSLLDLPIEVRNAIYERLNETSPIRMCRHDDLALANPNNDIIPQKRQYYNLTKVCRQVRQEFLPLYEAKTEYIIDLWAQKAHLADFGTLRGSIAMDIDAACFDMAPIDLLPLIRYLARTRRTNIRFASTEGVVFRSIETIVVELNKLLPSNTNQNWLAAVNGPMKRIDLHLFPHEDVRNYYRFRGAEPMLRIVYPSAATEGWMKQSNKSGGEYEAYLVKTGLDVLDMHIVIGHASRRTTNADRLPLDWRLSYVGSRLSLDQAVRISGTFSR